MVEGSDSRGIGGVEDHAADALGSVLAAVFNSLPNTTFSQNNGVIQMTGVASRRIGFAVAGFLVFLGLSPKVGALVAVMPKPVLGGATLALFGLVAAAGIRIISMTKLGGREMLILAVGLAAVPLFPEPALPMVCILPFMGFPAAVLLTLVQPLIADIVDFDEERTGFRREGMYTGTMSVFGKTSVGLGAGLVPFLVELDVLGDVPYGLLSCGPIAGVLLVFGILIFRKHPLD